MKKRFLLLIIIFSVIPIFAQTAADSVLVTFFYEPSDNPNNVYLPGEFNGWVINSPSTLMTLDPQTGIWSKTVRLRIGGPDPLPAPNSIPGAYQYKFNADGNWLSDPLNPRQNPNDNNNSYLFIIDPTIHYLLPNSTEATGIIRTRFPQISAYLFPSLVTSVDTGSIVISIDGASYHNIGDSYDPASGRLSFITPDPLGDGDHQIILSVNSSSGSQNSDSATFTVQADIAQILSRDAQTAKLAWRVQGAFFSVNGGFDSTVTAAEIFRPDSVWAVSVTNGIVDTVISLLEGDNVFQLQALVNGQLEVSAPCTVTCKVNHSPFAQIDITQNGAMINLSAANSSDPDGQALTYLWREDPNNPELLGINGQTAVDLTVAKPAALGEYYVELTAQDPDSNTDSTWAFFVVVSDTADIDAAGFADNPAWLKQGRIYLMFFKAFTPEGTIQAAIPNLDYVKAMGFNIIWVMPVMEIPGDVDNQVNIGYNIIDFFNVEQSLGTNQDFKDFIDAAHSKDIKVVLDITPNHTGRLHPLAQEALTFGEFSPFWNYFQTEFINHNTNGLGSCVTPQGIYYYCAFSDALLNYDWSDLDARDYMISAYKHWVGNFDIDGFRFDVYWGPHRKYGEVNMGIPVREALKHIKPDILLLGEDSGTGVGTEVIYADNGGGLDLGYDSKLYFNSIGNFSFTGSAVNTLHSELDNGGFYPGENSYYLRFMENQDEDRISYKYNSFVKTLPVSTVILTAPGVPQILNGQEVGFGKGMGAPGEPDLNNRRRGVIDWNFGGKAILQLHYQRLTQIRAQFPAFTQHKKDTNGDGNVNSQDQPDFSRVTTGDGLVYAFVRPYTDENGLAVVNFSNTPKTVTLDLTAIGLKFTGGFNNGTDYWINDLYADTSAIKPGASLASHTLTLEAYGSAVYVISLGVKSVNIPPLPALVGIGRGESNRVQSFQLYQNYPNPFNPTTTITFDVFRRSNLKLVVFNILGQRVKTLADKAFQPGRYTIQWDGRNTGGQAVASGIYFLHMRAGQFIQNRRMLLIR